MGVGRAFTVIVELVVAEQPFEFVTVTKYVVVADGLTVIAAVVAPVLHKYAVPPEAVIVADPPAQRTPSFTPEPELSDTDVVEVGRAFTVIVELVAAEQPFEFVTVTEYVVVADGLTTIAAVVAPVLHKYVDPPDAVKVALSPEQIIPSLLVIPELSATVVDGTTGVAGVLTVSITKVVVYKPYKLTGLLSGL